MKILKFFLIVILLSVLGFIIYRFLNKSNHTGFMTTYLQKRTINETIFIPGNVFPSKEIEIKPQLSGILDSIYVEIGESVKAGTPIASIKLVSNASDIERLENNVRVAQIDFDACLKEYKMEKRLYDKHAISLAEMDGYTRVYQLAEENLISAKNQLDILKKGKIASRNISNIVTTTTYGTVIDIPLETGASVIERNNYNPGTTIALVAETNRFKFRTLIAEHYLEYVSLGDTVILTFNAYQYLTAKAVVIKISSKGTLENGIMKYLVDAEFAVTKNMPVLRSGYSATAQILLNSRKDVFSIEEKYLTYRNDSVYLYVLDTLRKEPVKRKVVTGVSDGIHTEILEGVESENKIITNYNKTD